MISLETLLPRVLRYAPNCPEPLAVDYLLDAARTVCARIKPWHAEVDIAVTTPARVDLAAALNPEWSAEILDVVSAAFEGKSLTPIAASDLDQIRPNWNRSAEIAPPRWYTQIELDTLSLVPRQNGALNVAVRLTPALGSEAIPEIVHRKFGELIAKGAAGEIMGLPNTEYANPALGGVLRSEFEAAVPSAARQVTRGQQNGPIRTKTRIF